ncbi:hypothetical protein AGOR_G00031280 [Albula goreensis]|uniref:Rap-GAP domain-containing protein n=1 Tax=Albula goreensis TaxID=1534307 RepID=A0A8T3E3I1_9TELE|nr:hypothetical protein AGOR_G00031280 [Albula goreensis]
MSTYRDRPLPHSAPQLLEVRGEPTAFCSSSPSLHPPYHEHHAPLSIPNGHCPPPTQTMQLVAPPTQVPSRSSVPKMGIRARVADWPPRRDRSRESLLQNGHSGKAGGGVNQGVGPFRRSPALLPLPRRRREAGFGSRLGGSSPSLYRPPPPLQRSSSEVTLSEQDPAEQGAEPGEGPRLGAVLYREYGSTSSIDTAAVPEQSFSHLLSQFHRERSPAQDTPLRPTDQPRVRQKSGGGEGTTSSLLRKLRITTRGAEPDPEPDPEAEEGGGAWVCPRSFVHYDVQSLLFDPHAAAASQRSHSASQRKNTNTATGASAASTGHAPNQAEPQDTDTPPDGTDAAPVDNPDAYHDDRLLISCPHFHIEAPGRTERDVSFLGRRGGAVTTAATGLHHSNASVSVLEVPPELQLTRLERLQNHSIEHLDLGARYYRQLFHNTEHSNYFGSDEKLGPVALSIRREKLEDTAELKDQYQYRIILRTTELVTLRGTVLEDSVLSTSRHGLARGLPLKEVLEGVVPELGVACLRLALATPKVTEQLLKLDEQGLSQKRKVGVLLCRAEQSMEEEMYNNEEATPAFSHFLELLGERVCLRGFSKYAAQLDTKTDSTGTHSLYTTYQDYEVMFHVSTMLPYMPNNPQQLLRKRHIGNDIVTIIFQEPGALPFTPQSIRSHFQHVFIIVRVHNPCSDSTCYSVAVTSMEDVPPFAPHP